MTVTNSSNKITYIGNGLTTQFAFTFKIFKTTDIKITLTDVLTGVDTLLTTNYSVNEVLISVEDNGVGIDLETNESKVFGLFKRIQNDESGSGIGMYIVNKLLENYGGKLLLKSELGKGSEFTVVIPFEKV